MFATRSFTYDPSARGPDPGARPSRRRRGVRAGLGAILALMVMAIAAPAASADAWSCDAGGYVTQFDAAGTGGNTLFQRADRQPDGSYDLTTLGTVTGQQLNAIGFRAQDGLMYAWNWDTEGVMRIERNPVTGNATFATMGDPVGIPAGQNFAVGTVMPDGTYFVFNGDIGATGTGYILDVSGPTAIVLSTITGSGPNLPGTGGDMAVNAVDNQLYSSVAGGVRQLTLSGGTLTAGPVIADGVVSGGQWFTPAGDGNLVQYDNTGEIYSTDLATGELTLLGPAPPAGAVDAASCPYTLAVTKDATPRTVTPGEEVTYTYTVASRALGDYPVDFVDQLPAGMTYVPGGVTVDPAFGPPNAYGDTDTLSISGTIARNETVTITARVLVSDDAGCGSVDNQAEATLNAPGLPAVTIESDDPTTPADPLDPTAISVMCEWSCDAFGYLFQTEGGETQTDIVQVDLATGDQNPFGTVGPPPPPGILDVVNAVGYNVLDDFFYAMRGVGPPGGPFTSSLVRIHSDGSVDDLGVPTGPGGTMNSAGASYPIGEVDANGHYWAIDSTTTPDTWYEVDLTTPTPTLLDSGPVNLPTGIASFGNDWSWVNGALYGFGYAGTNDTFLLRFDPATGTFDPPVAQLPIPREGLDQGGVIGASFVDASGYLYASQNATNIIYRIDPATGQTIQTSDAPGQSPGNDGARCANAPIPTITVTKEVAGRVQASDQFTVGLADDTGDELTSATTSGGDTTASTIDWPVSQNATYTITDAMAAGSPTPIGGYVKSIACTDANGDPVTTGGSGPNWTLTVADATDYTCNVTNGPPPPPPPPPPPSRFSVSLDKTASDGRVTVGDRVTYTLVARNAGPAAAPNRVVTDTVPRQLDVRDVDTTQGTCTTTGNDVRCAIGTLAANQAVTITVEAVATRAGRTTNAANINGCAQTPCAEVPVRIVKPRLRVSKKSSKRTINAGDTVRYTIRVRNPSEAAVRNIRVCDRLPSGLVYVSSKPKAKVSKGRHCWRIRSLKAGKRKTYKVTVRALSGTSGRKVNRVTATSPNARGTARAKRTVRVRAGGTLPDVITG